MSRYATVRSNAVCLSRGHWQDGGRHPAWSEVGVPRSVHPDIYPGMYTQHGTQGGDTQHGTHLSPWENGHRTGLIPPSTMGERA